MSGSSLHPSRRVHHMTRIVAAVAPSPHTFEEAHDRCAGCPVQVKAAGGAAIRVMGADPWQRNSGASRVAIEKGAFRAGSVPGVQFPCAIFTDRRRKNTVHELFRLPPALLGYGEICRDGLDPLLRDAARPARGRHTARGRGMSDPMSRKPGGHCRPSLSRARITAVDHVGHDGRGTARVRP